MDVQFEPGMKQDPQNITPAQALGLALMKDAHAIMEESGAEHLGTEFEYQDEDTDDSWERDAMDGMGGVDSYGALQ